MKFKEGENVHVIVGNELLSGWYNGKEFGTGNSLVKVSKDKIIATKDCFIAKEKEAELVVVPQFVADWISRRRQEGYNLIWSISYENNDMSAEMYEWLISSADNQELLARAWLDGYEVEKEPLYYVKLPYFGYVTNRMDYTLSQSKTDAVMLTESKIKRMDERYWQFAVPVEEVEGEA
ncbi:DUF1642 domain-containing protein [Listeria monocytogenes]|nr:DUF1642 domain-containing protein [Listeria monocytogenes]EDB6944124.1 DUF1642 domain-containing protein [Listeria monocytogenes]